MGISSDAIVALARVYLQTLALSLLFAGTGQFIYRRLSAAPSAASFEAGPGAFTLGWARGYFLGICAFLPVFVLLSRIVGAKAALWIAVALMSVASLFQIVRARRSAFSSRTAWTVLAVLLVLIAIYSVTNAALWLGWGLPPWAEPYLLMHFGSIHSARYANYAIFIAMHDRVPYLAQNGAQSMLASLHLLTGVDSPLAALMVWIPFSLAFLSLLIFGVFRSGRGSVLACAAATFLVMFCNIAISAVHVLMFDNGSPLAFAGYTDVIVAVATFILFCLWVQVQLLQEGPGSRAQLLLPALLGMTWCWYAPQNLVLATLSAPAVAMIWARKHPSVELFRRFRGAALAFALAIGIGATQFGSLLPKSLREDTGFWTQDVESTFGIRPYTQYLRSHWTGFHWNIDVGQNSLVTRLYERTYEHAAKVGRDELYRDFTWLVEEQLWESIRVYGFPLLGLVLLAAYLRRTRAEPDPQNAALHAWLLLSLCAFGFGYAIYFFLELGQMKWWLTRFLMPGSAMALTCLGFAALGGLPGARPATRRAAWALLVIAATVGPMAELAAVGFRNFVIAARAEPIGGRLNLLTQAKGPFIFETLAFNTETTIRDPLGSSAFIVGERGHPGLALYNRGMPMAAGKYRVRFRVDVTRPTTGGSPFMELDVVADGGKAVVTRRSIRIADLERRADGNWALLDFELERKVGDVQLRLSNTADGVFIVSDVRLERLRGASAG